MIKFRQKIYGAGLAMIASTGIGMVQSGIQNKKNMAQQEDFQDEQARLQKQQNKALEKIAAMGDQNKAQQAAQVIQQRSYAATGLLQKGGQVVYDFARALNRTGGGNQITKKLGHGLAMGTTMAGAGYLVDKAIQRDRKRITGADLPKSVEENPGKKKKVAKKLLTGAALTAGGIIAARKGVLGQGMKNLSHGLNSAGQKINKTSVLKGIGQEYKNGFKEQFISKDATTGKNKLNMMGTGFTLLFPGMTAGSYILGERKQLKEQAKQQAVEQQKQYSEENQEGRKGSKLKKALIGTAITAGTIAAGRRGLLGSGVAKTLNNYTMQLGKAVAGKNGTGKLGNAMMESGAKYWGKAQSKIDRNKLQKLAKAGNEKAAGALKNLDFNNIIQKKSAAHLENIKSGKQFYSPVKSVASKMSGFFGTGGSKGAQKFLGEMAKDGSNSEATQKVVKYLQTGKGQTIATLGAVGVGSLAFKPFEWGEKAVKGATGAVDKNAFAYEKSQEQQV